MSPHNVLAVSHRPQLLVIDLGSQYTLKIVKSYEELGYRVALFGIDKAVAWLKNNTVKGIILSGGPASVNDADAPVIPEAIFKAGVPILAICYGMQAIAKGFGGLVASVEQNRGYSHEKLELRTEVELFAGLARIERVWASHGDSVTQVPEGFRVIATAAQDAVAAMYGEPTGTPIWCVQFHPEVSHTSGGKSILRNFASLICKCEQDWKAGYIVRRIQAEVLAELGDRHAVMGFSGGVDSTTLARILSTPLKDRLHCVLINAGQLRENEVEEIKRHAQAAGVSLIIVNAKKRFLKALGMKKDPEEVRKVFRREYKSTFDKVARQIKSAVGVDVVLVQGTLAPDLIESGLTGGALIKTHHNSGLGGLEPFKDLFKYEVRALARKLKLPKSVSERQPFPGPGEFLRLPGLPKTAKNLAIVKWADARTREVLEKHGWYVRLSQLVVAYGFSSTVGVKGDARVHKPVVVVRAVKTIDFMTAKGVYFPEKIAREIITVLTRHEEISRVFFDSTNKPPATTEME